VEEYLNKVKQLSDQLKSKKLELPKQVIIAWVLNSLTDNYEGFVSNLTQTLRSNTTQEYSLESLFSNLLDESKSQETKDFNTPRVLFAKYKGKKPYKITKGKYCKHCKLPLHDAKDCYFLFPYKAPPSWNKNNNSYNNRNKGYNNTYNNQQHSKDQIHPRDQLDEISIFYTRKLQSRKSHLKKV
jgi:hypothetical protein